MIMLPYILMFVGFLTSAAMGAMWTIWVVHVCRSGVSPIPSVPRILPLRRQGVVDEDDDDKPKPNNGRRATVGP